MKPQIDQPLLSYFYFVTILAIRYLIFATGTFIILWVIFKNKLKKYKLLQSQLPAKQLGRELKYSIQTIFIFAIGGLTNFFISQKGWGLYYKNIADFGWIYWWLSIFMMILINDLHFYWGHRILHWPLLYKKIHYIHHLSKQTTPLTSHSFHAIETVVNMSIVFFIPFIMPLHISAYVTFTTLAVINNVYGHCGYEFWPRKWIKHFPLNLLNLPCVHSWHHEKVNGNYGLYTTLWDRIFGTYKKPFES